MGSSSALGASGALARPWQPPPPLPLAVLLVLLFAACPGARAQTTIDNNFGELYGVGPATENCLNEAGSGCSGTTGPELNSCLCRRDRFALESARCIARVSPGDLDDVYFQMRANCLETGGFTLVVDQAEWVSAAAAATATTSSTSSTSSKPSTSTPARTSTDATATPTADDAATTTAGRQTGTGLATMAATSTPTAAAAAAAAGLDTGGKIGVGVAVAVGAILLTAGVFIWLKWRKRQRAGPRYADRDAHIMESSDMVRTYPPSQVGPGGGGEGAMGAGMYHKPPVGTASTSPLDQPSPELRGGGGGGGGGGHWTPGAQSYHPHQQQHTYPGHPSIAELGDGSDVTSHALSARDSARYSELPGGQSPLYPPPSSPSPVSPGPSTSPPLQDSRGGGPQSGAQG